MYFPSLNQGEIKPIAMKKIYTTSISIILFLFGFSASTFAQCPQICYNTNINNGCGPLTVIFTNTSTNPNTYYSTWSFGDGSPTYTMTVPTQTVSHTYSVSGNYMPSVNVYDNTWFFLGSNNNGSNIQVNGAYINAPDTACPTDNINFCGSWPASSWSWDFGDGGTASGQNCTSHTYTATGSYTVTLVENSGCGTQTIKRTIVINNTAIPNAMFNFNPWPSACPTQPVSFYANNPLKTYTWSFGDGNTSNQSNPTHSYTATGTYSITLIGKNGCNNSASYTQTISISNSGTGFTSGVGISDNNGGSVCPGQQVNLYVFGSGGFPKYVWDFGDGSPKDSSSSSVNHTFPGVGNYTVTCKIHSYCNKDSVFSHVMKVASYVPFPNQSWFKLDINSPACPGSNLNLNGPGGYPTYKWDFGDGSPIQTTNNNSNNNHTYSTLGTYTATLTVTNLCGNDSILHATVQITNNAPWSSYMQFNANSPACPNSNVGFNAPGGNISYLWNFGDGSPAVTTTDSYNNHVYGSTLTTYTASVQITNGCGKDTTVYTTVQIMNNVGFPNQSWFKLNANSPSCPNSYAGFDSPGGYTTYEWNFGDGSPVFTTSDNHPQHLYGSTLTTYTVSVKITNGCGKDTTLSGTIQIMSNVGFPNQSWFSLQSNSPICPSSIGSFQAPGGFPSYVWNFGDGSPAVTSSMDSNQDHLYGSTLGTYTVSVQITNGCGNDTTLYTTVQVMNNVGFPQQSWFQIYINNPSCVGDPAGFSAPNGYSNYQWNFGDGHTGTSSQDYTTHTYTAVGTYSVSVFITNTCGKDTTIYATAIIDNTGSIPSDISIEMTPNSGSCPNDIVSFRINRNGYSNFFWDFGDGSTSSTSGESTLHSYTATGTYTVSCKITNGCGTNRTIYTVVSVSNNSPVSSDLGIAAIQQASCPGDPIIFIPRNGQLNYTYYWNFGDGGKDTTTGTGATHTYTTVGNYTVSVIATNGCGQTKTVTMVDTVKNNATPSLYMPGGSQDPIWGFPGSDHGGGGNSSVGCAGDAVIFYFMGSCPNNLWNFGDGVTGTATEHMVILGGDGGTYPVTIIKHAFAANGTYTVSLTLTNSCGNSVTGTQVVTVGGNLQVSGDMSTSPPPFTTCAPVDFIGFGGKTYKWNFGDGSPQLTTSSPTVSHIFSSQGVYVASVIITNGCGNSATYSKSVNVTGVGGPAIAVTGTVPPTCINSTNASATISVSNGQLPYTYMWTNGQTTTTATGLSAGQYNVSVTDALGCSSTKSVSISSPAPIVLGSTTFPAGCGLSNGTATVTITSGGTAPFTYSWASGNTSSVAVGLALGMYNAQVTDSKGCTSTTNVSVSEANSAVVTLTSVTNASCNTGANGSINITVAGGTPPYNYAWSNGSTVEDPTGLAAGTYSVLVTDNGSCKATFNTSVSEPTAIVVATNTSVAPTCGNLDGSAASSASGGTSPYTYQWDAGAASQTTQTATGLPAGSYTVTVTDAKGCTNVGVISLSNSNAPNVTAVITNVSCFGGSNGAVDQTVTGGTSPYLYTWSNSAFTQDVTGLTAGQYIVTIKDKANCLSVRTYNISQPAVLSASVTNTGATCGNNDGTATANMTGGNAPFSYLWSAGSQTAQTAVGLALGGYTVAVTDSKGCTASGTTSVVSTVTPINICAITVDSTSKKNVIVWEKPVVTNIDSFLVYRNIATIYTYVGGVAYAALSTFTDNTNGVNPNVQAYKYEIRALDKCGNISVFSPLHQTIHLQVSVAAPPNSFNLSWNDYLGFPITQYRVMVDSLNNGTWKARDSVAYGSPLTWTDTRHYPDTVAYMIETDHPTGCVVSIVKGPDPMTSNLNLSKSNINRIRDTTGQSVGEIKNDIILNIYPNPTHGMFVIDLKNQANNTPSIKVFNVLGEEVKTMNQSIYRNKVTVDLSKQPQGVYYVQISSSNNIATRKIVIE